LDPLQESFGDGKRWPRVGIKGLANSLRQEKEGEKKKTETCGALEVRIRRMEKK